MVEPSLAGTGRAKPWVLGLDRTFGIVFGTLGIVSIVLPWVTVPGFDVNLLQDPSPDQFVRFCIRPGQSSGECSVSMTPVVPSLAVLAVLVFGCIVTFLRGWAGAIILFACLIFVIGFSLYPPSFTRIPVGLGAGFFLAVASGILSLSRYAIPHLLRQRGRPQS